MKTKSFILSFTMLFGMTSVATAQAQKDNNKETVVFDVDIDCNNCKNKIEKNIPFEKGVKALDVDMDSKTVTVTYDPKKTDIASLQEGFKKIGKEAKPVKGACCAKSGDGEKKACCKEGGSGCKKAGCDHASTCSHEKAKPEGHK
ncbi:MAG: heavy-metal-associated domain-containing protein [Prevotellaceae bacterium]|nr:heavy-metal-associated domain-containing protein [Prevotellaceae bacterium]